MTLKLNFPFVSGSGPLNVLPLPQIACYLILSSDILMYNQDWIHKKQNEISNIVKYDLMAWLIYYCILVIFRINYMSWFSLKIYQRFNVCFSCLISIC